MYNLRIPTSNNYDGLKKVIDAINEEGERIIEIISLNTGSTAFITSIPAKEPSFKEATNASEERPVERKSKRNSKEI